MSLTSMNFILFCLVLLIIYYVVPKRLQWGILLAASLYFYCMTGVKNVIFVLITSFTTYLATGQIQKLHDSQKAWLKENKKTASREEKTAHKTAINKKQKLYMILTLLINFGIMCTFKYVHFAIEQANAVIGAFHGEPITDTIQWIVPLGVSFYTFQTMGYLVDVYWGKVEAEKNYLKVLLFVSFFPQMTQGPISNFKELTTELFKEHTFTYKRFSWGAQRMIWGYFKKLVVANIFSVWVNDVFANYNEYTGITVLCGAFMYSIEIYADFSGYMDIICGFSEILDIKLAENFEQPYFSKSVAEYWRRWHITLGAWFKTYIYYPIAVAKWNRNIGKAAQGKLGKTFGQTVPASIALVVVWLATGLWHGASWAYIAWGGVNGLFIIASLWLEPVNKYIKDKLHIKDTDRPFIIFQIVRTFILVTFIKVLPEVGTLSQGWGLWKRIFTEHTIHASFHGILPFITEGYTFYAAMLGLVLIFVTDLIQVKQPVREWMEKHVPYIIRICIYAGFCVLIGYFSYQLSDSAGGFMYAQF